MPATTSGIPEYALCGKVTGAHGVRGWIKVFSHTRPAENLLGYSLWQLRAEDTRSDYEATEGRQQGRFLVAKLRGIEDRNAAEALRGAEIWVATRQFARLDEDEYYHHQLLGLEAIDQHGAVLGRVMEILETGANDVLVVVGEQEYLVPYVTGLTVLEVDLEAGRIRVRWEGFTQ